MNYFAHAQEGLLNIVHAKLRSILALLGILVGTASVVAMVLGGELATNEALRQFKSLGTDLLAITINDTATSSTTHLSLSDALTLKQSDNHIVRAAPYTQIYNPILYQGVTVGGVALGVTDSFADVVKIKLLMGRFVSVLDKYQFFCVIGKNIAESIKKMSYKNPIGQTLQMGNTIFTIVGVADSWPENNFVYASIDSSIMVPLLASTVISKDATINNMIVRLTPDAPIEKVERQSQKYLNQRIADKQITFRSAKELIARMKKQSDILTIFLGVIGSISLIVGGIGVMNIMLVSVIERKKEIGIRLAVGATQKEIGLLFLLEAVMLSLMGGTLGIMVGILMTYLIAHFSHWPFEFYLLPPLIGFSVSVAVGIFSGFYPAFLAAKCDPIEALKTE